MNKAICEQFCFKYISYIGFSYMTKMYVKIKMICQRMVLYFELTFSVTVGDKGSMASTSMCGTGPRIR